MFLLGVAFMILHWAYGVHLVLSGQHGGVFCFLMGFVYLVSGAIAEVSK